MFSVLLIAGLICVAIWVYLLVGHGRFWRIPLPPALANRGPERGTPAASSSHDGVIPGGAAPGFDAAASKDLYRRKDPSVAVVIPARNEAEVIGRAVGSLLRQAPALPGPVEGNERPLWLHIFAVDDDSSDGTAEAVRQAAKECPDRVTVIPGRPLPPGWSGKLWAVQQGVEQALALQPDYLLLTDADIEHDPHNVASLIQIAKNGGYELASYMVKLHCRTFPEKLLIPAFVFFFFMLYPPEWIRNPRRKTAGAAGGCILIRPAALERIGGMAAIRDEIIDDCALARAVKNTGGKVWMGTAVDTHSVRPYESFAEIECMIARTAFNQLRHSIWLLLGTIVGMLLIYVLPLGLMLSGSARLAFVGGAAFTLMSASYLPMVRFYGLNSPWALTMPFSAAFYTVTTLHSAVKYWSGRGGEWKGRAQDAAPHQK